MLTAVLVNYHIIGRRRDPVVRHNLEDLMNTRQPDETRPSTSPVSFLWLELTGKCGLECIHCYAESGPSGAHGFMTGDDWKSVLDQAAALDVSMVQFIGGEPTLQPDFPDPLRCAISAGLAVEVYTNLTHIRETWWDLLASPNVSLATSYYSDLADQHERITQRRGSHARTRANIVEAVRRDIPLRVGIIGIHDGQRVDQARMDLQAMGVTRIGTDHLRHVGRGAGTALADVSELCGNCGRGVAAISPNGDVWPCVFSRWMTVGNILDAPLADILAGQAMARARARIPGPPSRRCSPPPCAPDSDGNDCRPAVMTRMCTPHSCNPNRPCSPDAADGCGPSACRPVR